jgi:hypothetical protein
MEPKHKKEIGVRQLGEDASESLGVPLYLI